MSVNNPAVREFFIIDYHIVFPNESRDRVNGNFQYEGQAPSREVVLAEIKARHPDLDWSAIEKVLYTISRLMNNNSHIEFGQGELSSAELSARNS